MSRTILPWIAASVLALTLAGCKVEQTREGRMPDVDVSVTPGVMPEYDVRGPDVDVGTTTRTITVPEVTTTEREVTVPDVDVTMPQ